MVFLESFKGVAKSFWCGLLESVLKAFQVTFEGVPGVFLKGV